MGCIKNRLPETGLVGYVSDRPPIEFPLTAYVLSPLFVEVKKYDYSPYHVEDTGKDYGFIIVNSSGNYKYAIFQNRAHYVKVVDCGNGVRLYQNGKMRE